MYYFIACVVHIMICLEMLLFHWMCVSVCVRLREWWPTVSLSLSHALQGHSFPVCALDLVSAHRWIHFRCSCRHISCLKTTYARTSTQTACWHSAGHFSTAHPLRSSSPMVPFLQYALTTKCTLVPSSSLAPFDPKTDKPFIRQGSHNVTLRSFATVQLTRLEN